MFAVLETVAQHEHHRVDRDNCCQRRTFDANLKPKVRLHKADDQKLLELKEEVLPEQMEWRSINQEEPEPLKCKEEEEEVSIKQEENDIIAVIVNSEEELDSQFLQLHQSQAEENRKDSGLNRCLRPWVEDESDESSETEDSEDDWKETTEGSTPKTVKHKRASINVNNECCVDRWLQRIIKQRRFKNLAMRQESQLQKPPH
ncbi:uncharacterized protein LOC112488291 isoform X3 [Cynoglossus semilaevis]|uniref:uncharacterized protein LOC112488291 isoform X3 n=1 Tax=Cynoglossus semilaevis TaxID=244447 RepID=UPI000D628BD8|nr:uncharacterized protein LOC112488291 isoform X3 [Cynoglossus semilaevis]